VNEIANIQQKTLGTCYASDIPYHTKMFGFLPYVHKTTNETILEQDMIPTYEQTKQIAKVLGKDPISKEAY
jgi:hypothetical protein